MIEEAHESHLGQHADGDGLVHMAGPGVPPGTEAIVRRGRGTRLVQATLPELLEPGSWPSPLAPEQHAQSPSDPLVQFFEDPFHVRQPEVVAPPPQDGGELPDGPREAPTSASAESPRLPKADDRRRRVAAVQRADGGVEIGSLVGEHVMFLTVPEPTTAKPVASEGEVSTRSQSPAEQRRQST